MIATNISIKCKQGMTTVSIITTSQCSTLVRNTVVRAMAQFNGRWRFSDPWGSETPEPMKIKFGKIYCIGQGTPHAKIGLCRVGGLCPA